MRTLICLLMMSSLFAGNVSAESIFDTLKRKGRQAIEEKIEEELGSDRKEQGSRQQTKEQDTASTQPAGELIQSVEDLYGLWEGGVVPTGRSSMMDRVGLEILIAPEFASMRATGTGTRCLAQLQPAATLGMYNAKILEESNQWGTKATVTFHSGGQVDVNWTDSPNTNPDKRLYTGQLRKVSRPYKASWSVSTDQRKGLGAVGFALGMTYEQARAHHKARHQDLEDTVNVVRDEGTVSIIYKLKEKGARQVGPDVLGEQITLGFESQTSEELKVEQDPQVLAVIKEREELIQQQNQSQRDRISQLRQQRRAGRNKDMQIEKRTLSEIPPMPELRPDGADAELLFISRQVRFASNRGPHQNNVIQALTDKYGPPSIRINDISTMGGRIKLAWVHDLSGTLLANAQGGPCDHLTKQPSPMKNKETFYSVALRSSKAAGVYNLVTMSPDCGLTVKAQLNVGGDGSAYQISTTVYDSQRLLGDEWYRISKFNEALVAERKAKTEALKTRDVPDF